MSSTVSGLMAAASLHPQGVVAWGSSVPEGSPGVYVVAFTEDPDSKDERLPDCPISEAAIDRLLHARPELRVDARRPSSKQLASRIAEFWLPDEPALYIGLAGTSLKNRVRQYYRTPVGAKRPHAGGWFLKMLSNLQALSVHFTASDDPSSAEDAMLGAFCRSVSKATKKVIRDPAHPFPFANLEWPRGVRKSHGITGATGELEETRQLSVDAKATSSDLGELQATTGDRLGDVGALSDFLQAELRRRGLREVAAVEAARWLDEAGLLKDSSQRPGLPLRNLLRGVQNPRSTAGAEPALVHRSVLSAPVGPAAKISGPYAWRQHRPQSPMRGRAKGPDSAAETRSPSTRLL